MILVTGATGQIGSRLLLELETARVKFRALVRSAGKAEVVRAVGGEAVVGSFADTAALGPAFRGVTKLFLLTPPSPDLPAVEAGIVEEAKRAGVSHVVKLSAIAAGAQAPITLGRIHRESERHIETSGLAHTFLRPSYFMQNYLGFAESVKSSGAIHAPAGTGRHSDIDVRDIAAVAARVLTEVGHEGRVYELTGPEARSLADGARTIAKITGRDVRFVDVPPADARKVMASAGVSEWMADALVELYAWYLRGEGTTNGSAVTLAVQEVLDRPPRSFDQFVRENVKAFGG